MVLCVQAVPCRGLSILYVLEEPEPPFLFKKEREIKVKKMGEENEKKKEEEEAKRIDAEGKVPMGLQGAPRKSKIF